MTGLLKLPCLCLVILLLRAGNAEKRGCNGGVGSGGTVEGPPTLVWFGSSLLQAVCGSILPPTSLFNLKTCARLKKELKMYSF